MTTSTLIGRHPKEIRLLVPVFSGKFTPLAVLDTDAIFQHFESKVLAELVTLGLITDDDVAQILAQRPAGLLVHPNYFDVLKSDPGSAIFRDKLLNLPGED